MKYILTLVFVFSFLTCALSQLIDPVTNEMVMIYPIEGKKIFGKVLAINDEQIEVETEGGIVAISKSDIKQLYYGEDDFAVYKQIYRDFSDSYFFLPSARPVGVGNSHYRNYYLAFNQFNFAYDENISISAGFEIASLIVGQWPRVFYISPKYSIGSDENYVGIGTSLFISGGNDTPDLNGLAFVNYTLGPENYNCTLGLSYIFGDIGDELPVFVNLDAMIPLTKNFTFLLEFLRTSEGDIVGGGGFRVKQKGVSFDFGFFRPALTGSLATPLIGFAIPFK